MHDLTSMPADHRKNNLVTLCLCLACMAIAQDVLAQSKLPPRKPIARGVEFSGEGDTAPLIACPHSSEAAMQLGRDIAHVLGRRFGVKAVVVADDKVERRDYHRRTVILVGNVVSNTEILWLYSFNYAFADGAYPGRDGFVIRQVYDPEGAGRNALVIGASSEAGLRKGVARFIAELTKLEDPHWKTGLVVESNLNVATNPPKRLDDAEMRVLHEESLIRMQSGRLGNEAHAIIHAAHAWYLSGNVSYLQRYDVMTRAHRVFTDSGADQLYGGLEFWMAAYIQAWDIAEEADYWSDAQRDQQTQLVIDLANLLARRYPRFPESPSPRPRWNHETHPALAYFFLAKYLAKHRGDIEPASTFLRQARLVLGDQTQFVRGTDESGLYLPYAPSNALRYAIASRQHDMIDSGRAAQFGRLLRMMTDNTGRFVGAANRESQNIAFQYLLPLAAITGDATMPGLDRKTRLAIERPQEPSDDWGANKQFGEYRPPVEETPGLPRNQEVRVGNSRHVEVFPLDKGVFDLTNSEAFYARVPVVKSPVELRRAYDKLVFRDGYKSEGQYLLLDGYGRGKHYRYDTNAILRFTADDRVFLIGTDDDQRVEETYHNTLTFIRDGRGHEHVPPLAELEAVADLPQIAVTTSTVDDYSGLKWARHILWLKGSLFVVLDQIEALSDGEYNVRCHWNGLGQITLDDRSFRLNQHGRTCSVTSDGLATISVSKDRSEPAVRWSGYPHAAPVIHRVRQTRTLKLHQGERVLLPNVICTHDSTKPRHIRCSAVAPERVAISDEDRQWLICTSPEAVPAPFSTDARIAVFDERRITLVHATSLRQAEAKLFHAAAPVDCELDITSGTAELSKQSREASFTWKPSLESEAELATLLTNTVKHPVTDRLRPRGVSKKLAVSETDLPYVVRTALVLPRGAATKDSIVVGTSDGCKALQFDKSANVKTLWHVGSNTPVTALAHHGGNSDGMAIVFGTRDGDVVSVSLTGKERWRQRLTSAVPLERRVSCIVTADTNGDGHDETIVGTGSWNVHAFDDRGREIWSSPVYARRVLSLAAGDLSGDGGNDLLVGTSYYTLSAYNSQGQVLFGYTGEPQFQQVVVRDLDGDQQPEAIAANATKLVGLDLQRDRLIPRSYVKGGNLPRATEPRFVFDAGDQIHGLLVEDLNSDERPEVLVGAESGYLYCFDGRGKLLHLRNLDAAVGYLAAGPNKHGKQIITASLADGRVVLLDARLEPIGETRLKLPALRLTVGGEGVLCVTPESVGIISGTDR
ncbi:MAG: PQQ-binding-like beta-propeller repeat protein [Fuerstiella sp.]|nr:PQQ-binding-like beta-propeller repeat protein [Fuerstiella sp.]